VVDRRRLRAELGGDRDSAGAGRLMLKVTREGFPQCDEADVGRTIPFWFNTTKRVLGIGLVVGVVDILAEDLDAPPAGSGVAVGGPTTRIVFSDADAFARLQPTGRLQLGGERIRYTTKLPSILSVTGLIRGEDGTEPEDHRAGDTVHEILPELVYAFAWNPREATHPHRSLDAIYLGGRKKAPADAPAHTITLDDRAWVPGHSLVIVRFDMSGLIGAQVPAHLPDKAPPQRAPRPVGGEIPPDARPVWPPPPSWFQSLGAAATPGPVGIPGGGFGIAFPGGGDVSYLDPSGQLGVVEADLTGLEDDVAGTITGTPSALITRPAHIVRTTLREAWAERTDAQYDLVSFADTHALQVLDGLEWACGYAGEAFSSWREEVLIHGKAHLYQEGGRWTYTYQRRPEVAHVVTPQQDGGGVGPTFGFTVRTALTTRLICLWNRPPFQRTFVALSDRIRRYGVQEGRGLALPWITTEAPAKLLARFWLGQWDTMRSTVQLARLPGDALVVAAADGIRVETPLTAAWGGAGQLVYRALMLQDSLDAGQYQLGGEEADGPQVALPTPSRLRVTTSLSLGTPVGLRVAAASRARGPILVAGGRAIDWGAELAVLAAGGHTPSACDDGPICDTPGVGGDD
jgi:hypothetical protein